MRGWFGVLPSEEFSVEVISRTGWRFWGTSSPGGWIIADSGVFFSFFVNLPIRAIDAVLNAQKRAFAETA
jgi:hypothetical protein